MIFDYDLEHSHIDSCVTGGLTVFKIKFIGVSHAELSERSSDSETGKSIKFGERVAVFDLKDDNREL